MAEGQRKTEVIDLWSEDTKQDAWFTQSALAIGFRWLETAYRGFSVYLFSGMLLKKTMKSSVIFPMTNIIEIDNTVSVKKIFS